MNEATFSSSDIAAMQQTAWTDTVRQAFDRSPFYREHFARAGLSPSEKIPLDEIARIPAIDKTVVSENTEQFLCVPREKIVDIVTTSGSIGQPLVWQLTENDLERLARNEELSFGCAGFIARPAKARLRRRPRRCRHTCDAPGHDPSGEAHRRRQCAVVPRASGGQGGGGEV
jgi:phenylacetate-coenzyme A ligase PaaK-like adenylate-forming protein